MDNTELSIIEHLQELRKRLIIIFLSVFITAVILYQKILVLITLFTKPVAELNIEFVYFSLIEGFMTRFKVSLLAALVITSPIIFYEIAAFIFPGLTKREKKLLKLAVAYISVFFISGAVSGYILILPHVLKLLINYSSSYMKPILSGSMYFSFVGMFCIVMGIIFVMPLGLLFLAKQQLVEVKVMMRWRKYVIAAVLALELCFVPATDAVTFVMLVLPIIILYELNIWILYFKEKRKKLT